VLLVTDTNVLVYAFLSPEFTPKAREEEWLSLHRKASILYEDVLAQKHSLIIPSVVLIEIASVIAGMTGKEEKAKKAADNLKSVAYVIYDDPLSTDQAVSYAVKLKLSGFDARIASCAIINSANLVTNDKRFYDKFSPKAKEYGIRVFFLREMTEEKIRKL